jgi:hypothetical protein
MLFGPRPQQPEELHVFSNAMTTAARRSPTVDEIERRYLALHEGDREAAARNLAVDLMMGELRDITAGGDTFGQAVTRRLRRAAVMACGVMRLPLDHASVVYDDTAEHAVRRSLPGPFGFGAMPISRFEAAALTTRGAA